MDKRFFINRYKGVVRTKCRKAVVADIGAYSIKAGLAGDYHPHFFVPSLVGVSYLPEGVEFRCGPIIENPEVADMEIYPLYREGFIYDVNLFEKMFEYIYNKLFNLDPTMLPLMVTEPPWTKTAKRRELSEIIYEKLNVPKYYVVPTTNAIGAANKVLKGIIVDLGAEHSTAVPLVEGYISSKHHIVQMKGGGDYLARQTMAMCNNNNYIIMPDYEIPPSQSTLVYKMKMIAEDFNVKFLEVNKTPLRFKTPNQVVPTRRHRFANGMVYTFGEERLRMGESLFDLNYCDNELNKPHMTLTSLVVTCIERCPAEWREDLYNNIVVTGGGAAIPGLLERLDTELQAYAKPTYNCSVRSQSQGFERRYNTWLGTSCIASAPSFQEFWVTRENYFEEGPAVCDRM